MVERWLPVVGAEGRYEVSDQGRVRNATGRILSPNSQTSGYLIVHLYFGGRSTSAIHRCLKGAIRSAYGYAWSRV